MIAIVGAVVVLAAVLVGRSADRLGRRRVLLACLSVGSLVYFPQMLTQHPAQLLVLRIIMGLAMGGVIPIANAIIAERAKAALTEATAHGQQRQRGASSRYFCQRYTERARKKVTQAYPLASRWW